MDWTFSNKNKKNIRIKSTPGNPNETYVTIGLTNSFDFLQVLSLKLSQSEVYRLFDSPYGLVAGRVIGNEALGIPNCRISIFIPKEAASPDKNNPLENTLDLLVSQYYNYETVTDSDGDGRRYNLLTNQSKNRGFNGFPDNDLNIGFSPKTPVGSFPEKEEVLANEFFLTVYEKYYKYSTVTNESGDYILFGVPAGTYTIHMDCDLTDIGRWSVAPVIMSRVLGFPNELFTDNGTKIIASTDLDRLPNIQSQNISITVQPFWSQQTVNKKVGITRQDFKIIAPIIPSFTLFGSNFTMARNRWWGDNVFFRLHYGWMNFCLPEIGNFKCVSPDTDSVSVSFYLGYNFPVIGSGAVRVNCSGTPKGRGIFFSFSFKIPNILPFFSFEFGDNPCRLDGGKYDSNPLDIVNHGRTSRCEIKDALDTIPNSGIADALLLNNHRTDNIQIQLFSLKRTITDNDASLINLLIDNKSINDTLNKFSEFKDIELVEEARYASLIEPGQFALQIPTNRRLMITDEEGNLVDSPSPSVGVYTEFRGYLYVTSDGDFDSPEGKFTAGRVAMKIPQSFDYSSPNGKPGNTTNGTSIGRELTRYKEWIFKHGVFKAGEIYSVAQKLAIRNPSLTSVQEEDGTTLNGQGNVRLEGDPFDPNYEVSDQVGWDNQTGIILFSKDTDLALNPPVRWVRDAIKPFVGQSLDPISYTKAEDWIPPTHQTTIGLELDYKPSEPSGQNSNVVFSSATRISTGLIDELINPVQFQGTFPPNTYSGVGGYISEPALDGILIGYDPSSYPYSKRGMIAKTSVETTNITRLKTRATNSITQGSSVYSTVSFQPQYKGSDNPETTDGAINWYHITDGSTSASSLSLVYNIGVKILFLDTNNLYDISNAYSIEGNSRTDFEWVVKIPQLEIDTSMTASPLKTKLSARMYFYYIDNTNVYYYTPEFLITI